MKLKPWVINVLLIMIWVIAVANITAPLELRASLLVIEVILVITVLKNNY